MRPVAAEVLSIQRMICTGCGAEANASCNCGVSYIPKAVRAREAAAANPEKSNRALADELGVDEKTVRKARADQSAPETVTGRDGKQYPAKPKQESIEIKASDDDEDHFDDWIAAADRADKAEQRCNQLIVALNAQEAARGRDWPLDTMTKKQVKKREDALSAIASWQKSLEKLYAEVTGQPAWRVEITNKEGKRFANGLRFALRGEAEGYAKKQEEDGGAADVIACDGEKPNVEVYGETINFRHGDCVLFNWHPTDPEPAALPPPADDLQIPEYLKRS